MSRSSREHGSPFAPPSPRVGSRAPIGTATRDGDAAEDGWAWGRGMSGGVVSGGIGIEGNGIMGKFLR
ncbi:hypothetical protein AB0M50_42660 [Nonomuraea fuscirosea]|jgi:hypothetical protein|uniref:hypothetical protein n=1 Tax=Nonomuraea fuscirosea TaxID=1291556 RepID=UPI00341A9C45